VLVADEVIFRGQWSKKCTFYSYIRLRSI